MPPSEILNPPADLTDPAVLVRECESAAQGMDAQANAARTGSASAGHPFPDQFYGRVAEVLRAAGAKLKQVHPAAPLDPPGVADASMVGTGANPPPAGNNPADAAQGGKKGK